MGFGLCCVGFIVLMLETVGLDFLGYLLIGIGFLKVSKELKGYKGYLIASISAFIAVPVALLSLYSFMQLLIHLLPDFPLLVKIFKNVYLSFFGAVLCMTHCQSTANIAKCGGSKFFAFRAKATLYISALFYSANIAGSVAVSLNSSMPGGVLAALLIGRYVIPMLNAILLFSCFTTITTQKRDAEEKSIIKKQTELIRHKKKTEDQ